MTKSKQKQRVVYTFNPTEGDGTSEELESFLLRDGSTLEISFSREEAEERVLRVSTSQVLAAAPSPRPARVQGRRRSRAHRVFPERQSPGDLRETPLSRPSPPRSFGIDPPGASTSFE